MVVVMFGGVADAVVQRHPGIDIAALSMNTGSAPQRRLTHS